MKTTIVGIGKVGATLAYTLTARGLADELLLINRRRPIAEGEAADLQHAAAFLNSPVRVRAGEIEDSAGSQIIVLTCSLPWHANFKSRSDLGDVNTQMFAQLVPPLATLSPDAIFIVITNPVDVMTWHTIRMSGFPPQRVIGTGTLIDSGRLRVQLSAELGIHPDDVRAYILGEHGDSQFAALSVAQAGGERITVTPKIEEIAGRIGRAGYEVYEKKGYTCYAISMSTAMIIEAVAMNTCRTIPVSAYLDRYMDVEDICLSIPCVVGRRGIHRVLKPGLSTEESQAMRTSAAIVRSGIESTLRSLRSFSSQ